MDVSAYVREMIKIVGTKRVRSPLLCWRLRSTYITSIHTNDLETEVESRRTQDITQDLAYFFSDFVKCISGNFSLLIS